MQIVKWSRRVPILLAIAAAIWGKRRHKNASLSALVRRLLGHLACRIFHIPTPLLTSGKGSTKQMPQLLQKYRCKKPLIVTDKMLVEHGIVQPVVDSLKAAGLAHEVYDAVLPDPDASLIDAGYEIYKKQGCDSIVAIGGGSPMDVAKVIGAKAARPAPVASYEGYFMVTMMGWCPLPPLIAVPTTAGTGSETTVAAVVSIKAEKRKLVIADMGLVPLEAVLDPELLLKLPKGVTSATGMDALTHAIESYLSGLARSNTRKNSLLAVEKVFKHLVVSWKDGANLEAREGMLQAAYEAGLAFTRANVGNVHAIAHQFGGLFHTPHGTANAMLLPHILEYYLNRDGADGTLFVTEQYCELAKAAGLASNFDANSTSITEKKAIAQKFVARVAEMNVEMCVPAEVKEMKAADVNEVAARALREANGEQHSFFQKPMAALLDLGYAVPKYMTHDDCACVISKCLPADEKQKWATQNPSS